MNVTPEVVVGDLALPRVADARAQRSLAAAVRDLAMDDAKASRFPGPNPVSLDTSHFAALRAEPYVVCEKTDGVRFALVCCRVPAAHPLDEPLRVTALMDRKGSFFLLALRHVPTALFQGTLLDGELARNRADGTWDFLVFDAVCVSGVPVLNAPLRDRLDAAHRGLRAYSAHAADPVRLALKSFVACSRFGDADSHLAAASAKYDVDGVILTPQARPVVYGRHHGMFKLKFDSRHTVDFLVQPDGKSLAVFDNGTHVVVGALRERARPRAVAECALAADGLWDLVAVRADKATANDMVTYHKTLLNMRENLGLADLRRVFAG